MSNKHEVLMLKSIGRAFENIWCSYFSCRQGSEALSLHFYLYLFFMEFLRALILLVYSSLLPCFHWIDATCPWIEPFSISGWIRFGDFLFWTQSPGSCVCSLVCRLPKPHIGSIIFFNSFSLSLFWIVSQRRCQFVSESLRNMWSQIIPDLSPLEPMYK